MCNLDALKLATTLVKEKTTRQFYPEEALTKNVNASSWTDIQISVNISRGKNRGVTDLLDGF